MFGSSVKYRSQTGCFDCSRYAAGAEHPARLRTRGFRQRCAVWTFAAAFTLRDLDNIGRRIKKVN
jgi:hypothetical protein